MPMAGYSSPIIFMNSEGSFGLIRSIGNSSPSECVKQFSVLLVLRQVLECFRLPLAHEHQIALHHLSGLADEFELSGLYSIFSSIVGSYGLQELSLVSRVEVPP